MIFNILFISKISPHKMIYIWESLNDISVQRDIFLRWISEKKVVFHAKNSEFSLKPMNFRMAQSAYSLLRLLISFMILIVDILSFCWNSKKIRAKSFFGIGDMLTLGGWGSSAGDHRPQTSGDQIYCFTCLPDFCWSDFVEIWGFK